MTSRRSLVHEAVLAFGIFLCCGMAFAAYPDKPIKLVVGFPPGQATDMIARSVAEKLQSALGQSVIVENRPGAAGIIGSEAVAKARPDGYTLLVGSSGTMAINVSVYPDLRYHPLDDFEPVSILADVPLFLAVNPAFPVNQATDLLALAKSRPGEINYGSGGSGVTSHLAMELLKSKHAVDLTHIPYQGSPAAVTNLVGGHISTMFDTGPALLPHMKSGKLRILATTSQQRNAAAPDVPTMSEAGLGEFVATAWVGLSAPKGTPEQIVQALSDALKTAWGDAPDVRERLAALGAEPAVMTPSEFKTFIQAEIDKWALAVKASGLSAR